MTTQLWLLRNLNRIIRHVGLCVSHNLQKNKCNRDIYMFEFTLFYRFADSLNAGKLIRHINECEIYIILCIVTHSDTKCVPEAENAII